MKVEIKRVIIVSAKADGARLTARSGGPMHEVHDSWEIFDPPAFAAFLRRMADEVERAERAGNLTPLAKEG